MDNFIIVEDDLQNGDTGELVKGVRIMVEGKFKNLLDSIIETSSFNTYSEVIGYAITSGITEIISDLKSKGSFNHFFLFEVYRCTSLRKVRFSRQNN